MATITNFLPVSGAVGLAVTIRGIGLNTVTEVYFNTTRATTFIRMGGTQLRATVPRGATSGKIKVVTQDGEVAFSPDPFIVQEGEVVAIRLSYLRMTDLTPIETALTAAWNNAFASPSDPHSMQTLAKGYDPINLGSLSGGTIPPQKIDICMIPGDEFTPIAKGNAQLDFTSLSLAGLSSISNGGAPAFQNNDTQATFIANLGQLTVTGSFDLQQTCCMPSLTGCTGNFPSHDSDSLTYAVTSARLIITATVSTNPLEITVSDLTFTFTGSPKVSLGGDHRVWPWLSFLDGYILTENGILSSLAASVESILDGSQMKQQIESLLNKGINQ